MQLQLLSNRKRFNNEQDLVNALKCNDRHALSHLYEQNYHKVKAYVLKNSGSDEEAKDIFQEAIIALWTNLKNDKYESGNNGKVEAYLFQISKYKWLDKIKSSYKKKTVQLANVVEMPLQHEQAQEIGNEQNINYLQSLYTQLDCKCKEVVKMFYYEKKSLAEIAAELDYDSQSVRTIKYRCMMKLRKIHLANETTKS